MVHADHERGILALAILELQQAVFEPVSGESMHQAAQAVMDEPYARPQEDADPDTGPMVGD